MCTTSGTVSNTLRGWSYCLLVKIMLWGMFWHPSTCRYPLQCSCLENPRDGGAWWAAVYGVAQLDTTEATWQQQQQHVDGNIDGLTSCSARIQPRSLNPEAQSQTVCHRSFLNSPCFQVKPMNRSSEAKRCVCVYIYIYICTHTHKYIYTYTCFWGVFL